MLSDSDRKELEDMDSYEAQCLEAGTIGTRVIRRILDAYDALLREKQENKYAGV